MTDSIAIHSTITNPVKPTTFSDVEPKAASKDKGWIYVYDDEGTFDSARVADFESDQEAAISMIEAVIDWTNDDAQGLYSDEDIQAHLSELDALKSDVKGHAVDVTESDWFETLLGFTFSVKNTQS
ncbi:hypothetical protein L1D19_20760 [Vibrio natriegens]|uniref:hypothetical protein n=1 Tax=Vibrio natriegens TaxID=691 RepID=UPI001EFED4AC|nr:hypothetical protein [Vibrio natriegens]MCG9702504.1 hypothetical protein [Vibrio natriegens]